MHIIGKNFVSARKSPYSCLAKPIAIHKWVYHIRKTLKFPHKISTPIKPNLCWHFTKVRSYAANSESDLMRQTKSPTMLGTQSQHKPKISVTYSKSQHTTSYHIIHIHYQWGFLHSRSELFQCSLVNLNPTLHSELSQCSQWTSILHSLVSYPSVPSKPQSYTP
jgi:hypothetical protein